jgi:hypothetical protein
MGDKTPISKQHSKSAISMKLQHAMFDFHGDLNRHHPRKPHRRLVKARRLPAATQAKPWVTALTDHLTMAHL